MKPTRLPSPTLLSVVAAIAMVAAIGSPEPASARRVVKPMPPISATCGDLRDRLVDLAAQQAIDRRYNYWRHWRYDIATGRASPAGAKESSGPTHHTTTNNQEQGVDEGDTVKSDGKHIYTIANNQVVILDSWPITDLSVVARYKLPPNAHPSQLLLRGDQLVVLSYVYEQPSHTTRLARRVLPHWRRPVGFTGTRISVLDISNRRRPVLEASTDVEGWMAQARMIGDDVYVVTNASLRVPTRMARAADWFARRLPAMPISPTDWKQIDKLRTDGLPKIRAYLAAKFRNGSLRDAMPRTRSSGAGGQMSALRPMYACNRVYTPAGSKQLGVLNLAHIDLDRPRAVYNTGVFGSGWQIYASTRALYVAAGVWDQGGRGRTRIHKFGFGDGEYVRPRYEATGSVPGNLLNQFSMSEHRGYLRVATTDQRWANGAENRQAGNNLYVLGQRFNRLSIVGRITGLAKGERIYSARMVGDRGYVVTFRQTDPLFTLDLSNPREPRVVGELKINGFSSYIHPLGADKLLTIGRDADSDGRVKGIHLQIFDVSDPARPVRTHQKLLTSFASSWSAASHDHKAFTYDPVTKTLALPLSTYNYRKPGDNFSGLVVYAIDERGGFDELGRISHASGQRNSWKSQITRSMIIGDAIISLSRTAVVAHDLADLAASTKPIKSVSL